MSTLIICEKQNAASRIADVLSGGSARRVFIHGAPVYVFEKESDNYSVIGLRGHILELDYPEEFRGWHRIKPQELIKVPPRKVMSKGVQNIVAAIKELALDHKEVIIATDYDREGELIGVEGLGLVTDVNPDVKISRARFSALTSSDVKSAFQNLVDIDYNLSASAESRQIVDLTWGASLTRFISIASNQGGKDFLSVGRVQSPTLAIIVDREKDIKSFKPEPYWEIDAKLDKGMEFSAKHAKGRFTASTKAKSAFTKAKEAKVGVVDSVVKRDKKDRPPTPYSTTAFLRDATRQGFSAARAMSVAEELYTKGFISYPRTDNTVYPKSLDLRGILKTLTKSEFEKEAKELLEKSRISPSRGKTQTTDHPPIYPTSPAKKKDLNRYQWRIYELVVRRFFATLASAAVSEITTIKLNLNGELFESKGLRFKELGWRRFFSYYNPKEILLPEVLEGDEVNVLDVELKEDLTKPPNRYGEGSLIGEMERLGLGTKSTRHEIIQKLYHRGYVSGSPPKPTPSGIAVIEALEENARAITRARMTATLENDMTLVAKGEKDYNDIVEESQEMLEKVFILLEENKYRIGNSIKEALKEQRVVGKCKKCGGELLTMRSRRGKRFVGCSNFPKCRNSYPLPQRGKLDFLGTTCDLCGSPKIKFGAGRRKKKEVCINMKCEASKVS